MTQSTKIRGKFYPLQHSEWLRACQELTPSQRDLLYYIRTLDPYNNGIAINTAEIARTLSAKGRNVHRQTVSRALKVLDQKGFIDMEFITVNVRVQPLGLWYSKAVEGDCTEQTPGCPETPDGIVTHLRGSSDTQGTPSLPPPVRVSPPLNKINKTFSEGERETKVEQLKSDPEVNSKESCQPQTNNFPLPAQESVNSGEKFSAARLSARRTSAAAVAFQIPAEKKRGFYDAVRQYAANHGARCPSAYAKAVMADLERTGMCSLWDDFEAGLELGTSDRPSHEWLDPETGKPYPFLVRAVEEIAKAKSNDSVAAATEAAKIISNPKLCQPIWASVKRELLRYSKEAERMQRLGVRHTYLPPRYSDKPLEPALSEVKDAIASITPGVIKLSEKSEMTPPPVVETEHGRSVLEKSEATPKEEVKNREKSETLPDPWDFNPLEMIEQRERKAEEALDKARNEAQRQLRAIQMKEVLEQIKATLPTNPQQRQSQLQTWMNGSHPYPAIAKRLIEANQNWGLYLDGTRVLEEEF
ncbi:MAG: MarR family transcriptional regulator [Coleofasciculus sp.]|uniref:MarR family transcriptional regulator n=1 Tax=Coleofasciculus sp. TaxID=3100458 RepID=UPI003A145BBF